MKNKLITIIIPAYNEEDVLELFYKETCKIIDHIQLDKYRFEYLFINDGSIDNTLTILNKLRKEDARICFIDLSRNYGKEIALTAGLDNVNNKSDAVIIMDADLQHPPSLIPELIRCWQSGNQDVYAKRKNRSNEGFLKKSLSKIYYKILNALSEVEIQNDIGDFRLLDKKVLEAFKRLRETQRYNKGLFTWIGFEKAYVDYEVAERQGGQTKWSFFKLFNLAIEGITSSTTRPLRIASIFGTLVSVFAFIWLIKVFIKTIFFGEEMQGYPSLMITILFLGGIQLLSLGLIGEYLGRVFKETKNRPLYFLNEKCLNEET